MLWYCGWECQNGGWKDHKIECKKTREEYKTVRIQDQLHISTCILKNGVYSQSKGGHSVKSHFVVKVQLTMVDGPMLVYNEDKTIIGHLLRKGNEDVYDELGRQIQRAGFGTGQGFFRAILNKVKEKISPHVIELQINPLRQQIVENW